MIIEDKQHLSKRKCIGEYIYFSINTLRGLGRGHVTDDIRIT